MSLAELTNLKELTHVVIVGVEPTEEYAKDAGTGFGGWTEDIFGPFTQEDAATFAQEVEDLWKKERKRRRKNAFPYGEPFTKVRTVRKAGTQDAALNWVKEG